MQVTFEVLVDLTITAFFGDLIHVLGSSLFAQFPVRQFEASSLQESKAGDDTNVSFDQEESISRDYKRPYHQFIRQVR